MTTFLITILYLSAGSIAMWIGIMFINGTLFATRLAAIYEYIPSPWLRMLCVLPVMGIGHLMFSLAKKFDPVTAGPAGIVFTVIPPVIYSLWLLNAYPTTKIAIYAACIIVAALLLGMELNSLQKPGA